MKTILTAALLLAVNVLAFCQKADLPKPGAELQAGYVRETFKMRDKQVSPMMYVANLNGLRLSYARLTPKNQWVAEIKLGFSELIAPKLGIREFKFSEEQSQPIILVPTLYSGGVSLTYRRRLQQNSFRTSWAGISMQESFKYADGLAMTTWVMNTLAASFSYQTRFYLGRRHSLIAEASLPLLTAVSRMPYSNVVSKPELSNAKAFLKDSRIESANRYLNPEFGFSYRFTLSKRLALQAMYRYSWMRYPEPRLIRTALHTGNLSLIYNFHFHNK